MNVHLVMAVVALPGARTRHQLRLRTRRLELDYLAQTNVSLPLRFGARERPQAHPRQPDKSLGVGLVVSACFLEARDFWIV
jgi:hypothetical protein